MCKAKESQKRRVLGNSEVAVQRSTMLYFTCNRIVTVRTSLCIYAYICALTATSPTLDTTAPTWEQLLYEGATRKSVTLWTVAIFSSFYSAVLFSVCVCLFVSSLASFFVVDCFIGLFVSGRIIKPCENMRMSKIEKWQLLMVKPDGHLTFDITVERLTSICN